MTSADSQIAKEIRQQEAALAHVEITVSANAMLTQRDKED